MGLLTKLFGAPKLLEPQSKETEQQELRKINATSKEIKEAEKLVEFKCTKCGYHQGRSWDGKIHKCKACGGWLKYWKLSERVLENRALQIK